MQLSEMVGRIADAIEKYGWLQGSMGSVFTGFCTVGAARFAARVDAFNHGGETPLMKAIAEGLPFHFCCSTCSVVGWNDMGDQTKEEVVKHLRMVQAREQMREAGMPVEVEVKQAKPVDGWPFGGLPAIHLGQMWKQFTGTTAPPEEPESEESEPKKVLISV